MWALMTVGDAAVKPDSQTSVGIIRSRNHRGLWCNLIVRDKGCDYHIKPQGSSGSRSVLTHRKLRGWLIDQWVPSNEIDVQPTKVMLDF